MSSLLKYRLSLGLFVFGLVVSGVTAFPLQLELDFLVAALKIESSSTRTGFEQWILTVRDGLKETYAKYPWMGYGTDWLAFGHLIIALFFIGPFQDPVRNEWVLKVGLVACALVIPLALICGPIRHIPVGWRLIDCSFGVIGALPLLYCLRLSRKLRQHAQTQRG